MSQATLINELVNTTGKSGPNMTNTLKAIGDGNMQSGIKSVAEHFREIGYLQGKKSGEKNGYIKCSVATIIVFSTIYTGIQIKRRIEEKRFKKLLQNNGNRISKVMEKNVSENTDELNDEITIEK